MGPRPISDNDTGTLTCGFCFSQWNQEALYVLRACIRDGHSVDKGYHDVKEKLGNRPDELIDEALLARDSEFGTNALRFAAQCGREDWFRHCVERIGQRVSCREPAQCGVYLACSWQLLDAAASDKLSRSTRIRLHHAHLVIKSPPYDLD